MGESVVHSSIDVPIPALGTFSILTVTVALAETVQGEVASTV